MMFNFSKAPDLPQQLKWKYAEETELLTWSIRARNYNTFVANCMFAVMSLVLLGLSFFLYSSYHGMNEPWRTLSCLFFYAFMSFTTSCMTHQRMNFAYRITLSGVEYCEWKNPSKWALTLLKWLSGIMAITFIYLATTDPIFLVGALIGPGGIALTYLSMANSKKYQQIQTEYHHHFLHWRELTKVTEATNRIMIELNYSISKENSKYMTIGEQYVFFTKKQKENIINLIKSHLLSSTPYVVGKVDVLN